MRQSPCASSVAEESPTTAGGRGMKKAPRRGRLRKVAPVGGVVVKQTKAIPVARRRRVPTTRRRPLLFRYHVQPGGEISQRMHAGSLEALRVTRPEAVGLEPIPVGRRI